MSRTKRIVLWVGSALVLLLILGAVATVMVLRSSKFQEYVKGRIIQEIERSTGGRVDLGKVSFDWTHVTVDSLVLHGKEPAEEQPLLQVDSATLGLRVISIVEKKVDLALLQIQHPQVRIVIYPDGSTNIPGPKVRSDSNWSEDVLNLGVRRYEINDGVVEYDNRKVPLNLRGEHLALHMDYERSTPSYRGEVSSDQVEVKPSGFELIPANLQAAFTLEKSRLIFSRLRIATKESSAELSGTLEDMRTPFGKLSLKASVGMKDVVKMLHVPIEPKGSATVDGNLSISFGDPFTFGIQGRMSARGLGYTQDRLKVQDAAMRGDLRLDTNGLSINRLTTEALGSTIEGRLDLEQWRKIHVTGTIANLDMHRAASVVTDRPIAWDGTILGTFDATSTLGQTDAAVRASLAISPGAQGVPLQGQADVAYDQRAGTVALGSSAFSTPATRLELAGTLGQMLRVSFRSTNLDDVLPTLMMIDPSAPSEIRLKLKNGSFIATGSVTGSLDQPQFVGQVAVTNGVIQGHSFDRFNGTIEATRNAIQADQIVLARGATQVTGSAKLTAEGGNFADAGIMAQLELRNARIGEFLREVNQPLDADGIASATVSLAGSIHRPEATIAFDVQKPTALGEQMDRLRGNAHYTIGALDVTNGVANDGGAEVQFSGGYRHSESDWRSGDINFDLTAQNFNISRIEHVARFQLPVDGLFAGKVHGTGRIAKGTFDLTAATADVTGKQVTVDRQSIGDLAVTVETKGTEMTARAKGNIRESNFDANGTWRLEGDASGQATVRFTRMSLDSIRELASIGQQSDSDRSESPVEGFISGGASINLALQKPETFTADITLDTVQVNPRAEQELGGVKLGPQDIVLKSNQPVTIRVSRTEARVTSAQFTGRDSDFNVTGTVPLTENSRADLTVRGRVDLTILQLWNSDLLVRGNANVIANIRGSIQDPNVSGRMDLNKASLYINGVDNGVDSVSGGILFDRNPATDRNRATIEDKLTAQTGGGTVDFTGSVDFGSTFIYRLQANARKVRVRWPEDVSTTFGASLRLTGTSQASTLSGAITLNRVVFTPRTDLFQLIAQVSKPVPVPETPSDYLRGMKLDVRVESGGDFQFETSLTEDVEADVSLQLHGTPVRPVLQGAVSVNQGEVRVLGNKYTINRGEIRFLNLVSIEPTLDMDLETKARGVTVDITLSGTMQKLKVNYSSDPPLLSSEIIALLSVGRDPTSSSSQTAPGFSSGGASSFVETGNGLLGQAVSAQLSSRLQRFFGASHVKIDPTLTGVDNLPQARLTLEQQVSKDITLTYITNLNRTQEQIVRVEWDLDRNWSAVAVRDPNGWFGIDFQFRKRLK